MLPIFQGKKVVSKFFKIFCIPESFNTNISHNFYLLQKTFVNSQHKNKNSKDDLEKPGLNDRLKVFWYQN